MTTVVYVVNRLRGTGPVHVLLNIVRHLDRTRFRPVVLQLMDEAPDSLAPVFGREGVEVHRFGYSFADLELRTRRVAARLDRFLAGCDAGIIHTHGYHPVLVASHMKTPAPKITTLHNVCGEDFRSSKGALLGGYMAWRYLRRLDRLEACAAISSTVRDYYAPKLSHARVRLVYNGVDATRFTPAAPAEKAALRGTLGLPAGAVIYVAVGNLSRGKDPLTVVRAFRMMRAADAALVFLGRGPLEGPCKALAADDPRIIFRGHVSNVDEYLRAADHMVCASRSEGFGLNFVEALMADVPVIGSDIGPFREFAGCFPELRALQFPVGDADALRERLEFTLRGRVAVPGIGRRAAEIFSAQAMGAGYMEMYDLAKMQLP